VRVPVRVGHSESVHVEFHRPIGVDEAKRALANAPGIVLVDDYGRQEAPTPLQCEGRDEVFVGRLRKDLGVANGLNLWVVADSWWLMMVPTLLVGKYSQKSGLSRGSYELLLWH